MAAESHSAFVNVDDLVKKPVHGSDGALNWQNFRNENKGKIQGFNKSLGTVAPHIPLSRKDRKDQPSLKSFNDERQSESQKKIEDGSSLHDQGYIDHKGEQQKRMEEKVLQKKVEMAKKRIRPPDKEYFIAAKTYEGSKRDYVFTTKPTYGTGYYWDGMDSAKEAETSGTLQQGDYKKNDDSETRTETRDTTTDGNEKDVDEPPKKKKKKKKKKKSTNANALTYVSDPNHPMEQVANAIARRQMRLQLEASSGGPNGTNSNNEDLRLWAAGWAKAVDPSSNKTYYYNTTTQETKWENPLIAPVLNEEKDEDFNPEASLLATSSQSNTATSSSALNNSTALMAAQSNKNDNNVSNLPKGWQRLVDAASAKEYFYNSTTGKTTWDRPWI